MHFIGNKQDPVLKFVGGKMTHLFNAFEEVVNLDRPYHNIWPTDLTFKGWSPWIETHVEQPFLSEEQASESFLCKTFSWEPILSETWKCPKMYRRPNCSPVWLLTQSDWEAQGRKKYLNLLHHLGPVCSSTRTSVLTSFHSGMVSFLVHVFFFLPYT